MLNNYKPSTNDKMTGKHENSSWIIDTVTSNHMTGNWSILRDLRHKLEYPVCLPNGSQTVATKVGTTRLDDKMSLKDVLYVPGLTCNLWSVSQLIDDSDCIAAFSKHGCVLQDRTSKMLIGAGEHRDGLYYFEGKSCVRALKVDKVGLLNPWH